MEDWIYSGRRTRFLISDEQMAWNIYDLLGGNHLTIEITEYLITLILDDSDFDYYKLYDRLSTFFLDWRDGLFIDKPPAENLPQRKMLQMASFDKIMGIREVDIHTGINVLIILLELSRASKQNPHKQIYFNPGFMYEKDGTRYIDPQALRKIIGYCSCLSSDPNFFIQRIQFHLPNSSLSLANLCHLDLTSMKRLSGVDFSKSNLSSSNLAGVFLTEASFVKSNLRKTILVDVELIRTDFREADLRESLLCLSNLTEADFRGTNLSEADLSEANLADILWDDNTNWDGVKLDKAENIPERLKQQLGLG